jgi:hypothetical protein
MEMLTYDKGVFVMSQEIAKGSLVFYRVEDANGFLHLVRVLRGLSADVRATVEQIPVRFEGDGEKNVYRVEYSVYEEKVADNPPA